MIRIYTRAVFIIVGAILLSLPHISLAQKKVSTKEPLTWVRMPGAAVDISINSRGQAYTVAPNGTPWRWDRKEQRWRKMSGDFVSITAAEGNRPWAVNKNGVVYRYNGLWWEDKSTDVSDVAADASGNAYIAKLDGKVSKWNPLRNEWQPIGGSAERIALDDAGNPWAVTGKGEIELFDGEEWNRLPGRAIDVAIGGDGTVAIVDERKSVRTWDEKARRWNLVKGITNVFSVAVAPDGGLWATTDSNVIMVTTRLKATQEANKEEGKALQAKAPEIQAPQKKARLIVPPTRQAGIIKPDKVTAQVDKAKKPTAKTQGPDSKKQSKKEKSTRQRGGSSDPATLTAKGAIKFTNTRKTASELAIGKDGSVFGLDQAGNVLRWSNEKKRFESFPGTLANLAIDPEGNPWGINFKGRVFRHDGVAWQQIHGATGSDITIGRDGTVIITNAEGRLYQLNKAMTRFDSIPGNGVLVAVAPDGVPWSIRPDGLVQRCEKTPCKVYPQKAKSIDIGPDGSVYIISNTNYLMRLAKDKKNFERLLIPGHTPQRVAVGPKGLPWVITTENLALASSFFERDEGDDRSVAISTRGDTEGTGSTGSVTTSEVSGFIFTKSMKFETVPFSALSPGGYPELAGGADGSMWAYTTGADLEKYDTSRKKFVRVGSKLFAGGHDLTEFDVASNGDIWAVTINPWNRVYRETKTQLKNFTTAGAGTPLSVSVAPDDTVYVVYDTGEFTYYLYKKEPDASSFKRFTNANNYLVQSVSVGPGNDVWIIDGNIKVRQWTGKKFETRPAGKELTAINVRVGLDGTVYIVDGSNVLRKWNGANNSFDEVRNTNLSEVAVDADGRPWMGVDSTPLIKRAKD